MSFASWADKRANKAYVRQRYHRLAHRYFDAAFTSEERLNVHVLPDIPTTTEFENVLQISSDTGHVLLPSFFSPALNRGMKWKQSLIRAMVRTQLGGWMPQIHLPADPSPIQQF
jgi:hypothetical protein